MKRRKFLIVSGSTILTGTSIRSVQKPSLGLKFEISSTQTEDPRNLDSVVVKFNKFDITPQYLNENSDLDFRIELSVEGSKKNVNVSGISFENGSTTGLDNINTQSRSFNPISVDSLDFDNNHVTGEVRIELNHPDLSSTYKKKFSISDGFPNSTDDTGVYNIETENYQQDLFFDMHNDNGNWILVSSHQSTDNSIPDGLSRKSDKYEINRPEYNGPLVGSRGISPNGDYIIGPIINEIDWTEVRVVGWDRSNTGSGNTYSDATKNNVNNKVKAIWSVSDADTNTKLTEAVSDSNVDVTTYNTSIYDSRIDVYYVDGIKTRDVISESFNENQTTIGGAGRTLDSSSTWFGHGSDGTDEGWYNSSGNPSNSLGWATFVR